MTILHYVGFCQDERWVYSFLNKPQQFWRAAPFLIEPIFTRASDVHSYNTRFCDSGNLYVSESRLSTRLNSFSILELSCGIT